MLCTLLKLEASLSILHENFQHFRDQTFSERFSSIILIEIWYGLKKLLFGKKVFSTYQSLLITWRLCNVHVKRAKKIIRSTNKFRVFFWWFWSFIQRNWYNVCYSNYCPSLSTTFYDLYGSIRIPRLKRVYRFETRTLRTQRQQSTYVRMDARAA